MKKILLSIGVFMGVVCASDVSSGVVGNATGNKELQEAIKSVLPSFETMKLDNGLEIVVIPLKNDSGVVQTNIVYKVGSRDEVMGKSGIAHMLEHLSFKATKKLKAGEFDEIVKGFGGINNAMTSFDYTQYFIRSSAQNVDKSLELFAELMQNLLLKEDEFKSERQVVAEERRWRTDNSPVGYLFFRFFNTAFLYHPYHWTPIGFMDDILSWKINDIKDFHATYYQPNNAIVLVAGDIDPKVVFQSAKKHFSPIKNTRQVPKNIIVEPKQDGYREVIVKKDTEIEWVMMGYKIPNFEHKDSIALSALGDILSGGKSAILDSSLIDKKRIASEVSAYPMSMKDSGIFIIMAAGNENIEAKTLQKEILTILEDIKQGKFTQEELDKVKTNMRASFVRSFETASATSSIFGSYIARGNAKPLLEYEREFSKLSLKDIQEVANKYFIDDELSVAILKK